MKVSSDVRAGWEHRFPPLAGKWTHWRIYGDDKFLAEISGDNLPEALAVVEKHFGAFISIKAQRSRPDASTGTYFLEQAAHEISNFAIDSTVW